MPTVSGRLIFDSARTATASPAFPGVANVPVVLQNIGSGAMLAVLTDTNGGYAFTNVPDGNYQLVESFGMAPAVATPGDFTTATVGAILSGGVVPPLRYAPGAVPAGATHLDCVTPNTFSITVSGLDVSRSILNGPVRYSPITRIIDSHAVILPDNILDDADDGTFGSWPPGTPVDTWMPANPYPGVGTGFNYSPTSWPRDGNFSILNIDMTGFANWWGFADHTTGNETGRMMVINGDNPGAVIYEETVPVKPNSYYLFTTWILNAMKVTGFANPALGVQVLDQNGRVLIDETLGQRIPVNVNTPEWVENGSVIYSGANSTLTVRFLSQGPAADGNDYVMDDIGLHEVTMPDLVPEKSVSVPSASVGETVTYTVTLKNDYDRELTDAVFHDPVPDGLAFVPGSVAVNGTSLPAADPNAGFALPDIPGGRSVTVTFSVTVNSVPKVNPAVNTARMTYDYTIVEGGIPSPYETESNETPLLIEYADIAVIKKADVRAVKPGKALTYTVTVTNKGPSSANNVVLTDTVPADLLNAVYSTDGGTTWQPWGGSLNVGTMANGLSNTILIRGTASPDAVNPIINTAAVSSTTHDPDLTNNTSTSGTKIFGPRCQAIADVIESVSMQETALSHVLNAEGEKIQAMLRIEGVTAEQLLALNDTATRLVEAVTRLEMTLQAKLRLIAHSDC